MTEQTPDIQPTPFQLEPPALTLTPGGNQGAVVLTQLAQQGGGLTLAQLAQQQVNQMQQQGAQILTLFANQNEILPGNAIVFEDTGELFQNSETDEVNSLLIVPSAGSDLILINANEIIDQMVPNINGN